jgi:hypothetical protein
MSTSTPTSIGGGNKSPSSESNSVIHGDSVSKKTRTKRHVFTPLEKEILVNLYNTNKGYERHTRCGSPFFQR